MKQQKLFLTEITDTWNQIYTDIPQSRRLKRKYIKEGYDQQISFYGVIKNKEKDDREYRRIEILSNIFMTRELIDKLYYWFHEMIPPRPYTIWIYDVLKDSVAQVGAFD